MDRSRQIFVNFIEKHVPYHFISFPKLINFIPCINYTSYSPRILNSVSRIDINA